MECCTSCSFIICFDLFTYKTWLLFQCKSSYEPIHSGGGLWIIVLWTIFIFWWQVHFTWESWILYCTFCFLSSHQMGKYLTVGRTLLSKTKPVTLISFQSTLKSQISHRPWAAAAPSLLLKEENKYIYWLHWLSQCWLLVIFLQDDLSPTWLFSSPNSPHITMLIIL